MKTLTLEQRLERDWVAGKVDKVTKYLRELPADTVLETLVVVADRVPIDNRLKLLSYLDPELTDDGSILALLSC